MENTGKRCPHDRINQAAACTKDVCQGYHSRLDDIVAHGQRVACRDGRFEALQARAVDVPGIRCRPIGIVDVKPTVTATALDHLLACGIVKLERGVAGKL